MSLQMVEVSVRVHSRWLKLMSLHVGLLWSWTLNFNFVIDDGRRSVHRCKTYWLLCKLEVFQWIWTWGLLSRHFCISCSFCNFCRELCGKWICIVLFAISSFLMSKNSLLPFLTSLGVLQERLFDVLVDECRLFPNLNLFLVALLFGAFCWLFWGWGKIEIFKTYSGVVLLHLVDLATVKSYFDF